MERLSRPFNGKNYWKKNGYSLLDGAIETKRKIQVVKIKGETYNSTHKSKRFWRIKKSLKFKSLKKVIISPKKLWSNFKNGYMNMMLKMATGVGHIDGGSSEFENKRFLPARQAQVKYKNQDEFETRLVFEIYKALSTSKGLSEVA